METLDVQVTGNANSRHPLPRSGLMVQVEVNAIGSGVYQLQEHRQTGIECWKQKRISYDETTTSRIKCFCRSKDLSGTEYGAQSSESHSSLSPYRQGAATQIVDYN